MQERITRINTPDEQFHDGNPLTGTLGTIVSADWLNNIQSATVSNQEELLTVIQDSGQKPDPKRKGQLLQAVNKVAWNGNARPTTLAGYGITDGVAKDSANRVQAASFRAKKGQPTSDASGVGFSFEGDGDTGFFAKDGTQISGSTELQIWNDGTKQVVFNKASGIWSQHYGWLHDKFAAKATTLGGYGITDGATKARLQDCGIGHYAAQITSGSLQTVRPNGFYHVHADKASGSPHGKNGMLMCHFHNSGWGYQTYHEWGGAVYHQRLENTIWQPWVRLAHASTTLAGYGITDALPLKSNLGNAIDLNSITATGLYHQQLSAHASAGKNYPVGLAGKLEVYTADTMVYQIYHVYDNRGIWYRSRYNNNWFAWQKFANSQEVNQLVPAGAMMYFLMPTPPVGWLKANGAAVSRSQYAALFTAIGTIYGAGNGSTTFNLPDLRGEFVRGWDDGRGVDAGRWLATWQTHQLEKFKLTSELRKSDPTYRLLMLKNTIVMANTSHPPVDSLASVHNGVSDEYTEAIPTAANIGTETRPRNIALLPCIKY